MKTRKIISLVALVLLLAGGLYAVIFAKYNLPPTLDGTKIDVEHLYEHPEDEDLSDVDGAAAVIVRKNLGEAYAANDVASVVFDFRGYDTLGESFILLTAIAGSFMILARHSNPSAASGGTSPVKERQEKEEGKEDGTDEV